METATSVDGTTLAYDRVGEGPPLILLGGATCTRGITLPLAQALSEHVTVINPDRRGRGDSNDLSGPPPYDPRREVEDVAALVEAAGGAAAVYGHSSGAALALHAATAGIGVTSLVMHDAPFNLPGTEQRGRDWDALLTSLLAADRRGEAIEAFLTLVGLPSAVIEQMREGPYWPAMEAVAPTLAYDSAAMGDRDGGLVPAAEIARVDVPTLVVVGGADHDFMIDVAHRLVEGIADARLEHLVGASHDVGPEIVVPAILPFLLS
ncbi:alpha/beta fold hydrolase [Aeromicrobium sp.]|uniref:alpha/beta fold hydrolase n=1 Tax=Aeromicrobium sp. TaxID=1871063 RepID=UPI003C5EF9A9